MHNVGINSDWICCDHTFKSITDIGIYQPNRSAVLNMFSNSNCFLSYLMTLARFYPGSLLTTLLWIRFVRKIKTRLAAKKENLREIYVDDCCKVR